MFKNEWLNKKELLKSVAHKTEVELLKSEFYLGFQWSGLKGTNNTRQQMYIYI